MRARCTPAHTYMGMHAPSLASGAQTLTWGPCIALGLALPLQQLHGQPKVRDPDIA